MNSTYPARMLPVDVVAQRLARDLAEKDRLQDLLYEVLDGYRFTNRLDEAVLLVPASVLAEIREALGFDQEEAPR